MRWTVVAIAAGALIALGATGAWLYLRSAMKMQATSATPSATAGGEMAGMKMPVPGAESAARADTAPLPDVTITLTQEAVDRAGIEVTPVRRDTAAGSLRLSGVVEANDYRQVAVTPIAAGRVTRVAVALGDRVTRGQSLA
ncbi:MAG: hypothetical protein H0T71_12640, partial [Acidobacteria bacterium]|nr:hypothetical protein [Acidobacteriota bacterium]